MVYFKTCALRRASCQRCPTGSKHGPSASSRPVAQCWSRKALKVKSVLHEPEDAACNGVPTPFDMQAIRKKYADIEMMKAPVALSSAAMRAAPKLHTMTHPRNPGVRLPRYTPEVRVDRLVVPLNEVKACKATSFMVASTSFDQMLATTGHAPTLLVAPDHAVYTLSHAHQKLMLKEAAAEQSCDEPAPAAVAASGSAEAPIVVLASNAVPFPAALHHSTASAPASHSSKALATATCASSALSQATSSNGNCQSDIRSHPITFDAEEDSSHDKPMSLSTETKSSTSAQEQAATQADTKASSAVTAVLKASEEHAVASSICRTAANDDECESSERTALALAVLKRVTSAAPKEGRRAVRKAGLLQVLLGHSAADLSLLLQRLCAFEASLPCAVA